MQKLLRLTLVVFLIGTPRGQAINYFRCEKTEDCVQAYGGCGRYLAVHRRYRELYSAKAHKGDRVANCLPPSDKDKLRKHSGVVVCEKQQCRLKLPAKEAP